MAFTIHSPIFANGQRIPERYAHPPEGEDIQPPIQWADLPAGTRSLALLCEDPDAPQDDPFVHWVLAGFPADRQELVENEGARYLQGRNDFDRQGWGGPLPPEGHGPHRYHFKLFALDQEPQVEPGLSKQDLLQAIDGHVLATAELVGSYER
jgi:Raf kinase inhibitor-like YbhB/YbcL family protein